MQTMHAVIEMPAYLRAADKAGMTDAEREATVSIIANDPLAGDEIKGTGGCRKVRIAGRGKGKSGGYRVITYYGGMDVPVFLLTVFSKGQRADLTQRERNGLAQLTRSLVPSLGPRFTA
jgi:hypothetical protein